VTVCSNKSETTYLEESGRGLIDATYRHEPDGTEEDHEISPAGWSMSLPKFEPGVFLLETSTKM
jgi:hypothetical protein